MVLLQSACVGENDTGLLFQESGVYVIFALHV